MSPISLDSMIFFIFQTCKMFISTVSKTISVLKKRLTAPAKTWLQITNTHLTLKPLTAFQSYYIFQIFSIHVLLKFNSIHNVKTIKRLSD